MHGLRCLYRLARHPRRLLATCALTACLGSAGASLAQPVEPATDPLRLSGFGTAGITRSSAPPGWGFQRESSQAPNDGGTRFDTDSRLGLQANYAIDPRLEFVGQVLLMRRISDAKASDAVAWAFAAYRPTDSLTVRLGRLNAKLYQLADYRSVGLAYPFVRPPAEFYILLPPFIDGFDLSQSWRGGGDAIWKLSGFYGQSKQANNGNSGFKAVRPIYGAFLAREEQGLLVRASVARVRLADPIPEAAPLIAALQPLTGLPVTEVASEAAVLQRPFLAGPTFTYVGLGLSLDRNDWLLMMEASRASLPDVVSLDAGYVLLGRRWGSLTPYVSLSAVRNRAERGSPQWEAALTPVLGPAGAAQAQALGIAAYAAATGGPNQRTWSAGMRWDTSARTALKFQYDHTRIGARGSLLWSNGTDEAATAHVLSVTFDFIF